MIIGKLSGGLGNQMFQYAAGRSMSLRDNTPLLLDIRWYRGRTSRTYLLGDFNVKAEIARNSDIFKVKLFSRRNYLSGDFQSEKYFKNIESTLRKEFKLKNEIGIGSKQVLAEIVADNAVSIHLRGGDYVKGPKAKFHGTCSPEYYQKAVEKIRKEVDLPHFYIFTDDIEWAKNHISLPDPYTFVSKAGRPAQDELMLMVACKHNVIANSSFSWWGAWLNENPTKIVIAPKKWFNDPTMDSGDIVPESWIQI